MSRAPAPSKIVDIARQLVDLSERAEQQTVGTNRPDAHQARAILNEIDIALFKLEYEEKRLNDAAATITNDFLGELGIGLRVTTAQCRLRQVIFFATEAS